MWQRTGDASYFTYIQKDLDQFVQPDGSIRTYKLEDYNLDNLTTGHALLMLSQMSVPQAEKYQKAAKHLRQQLAGQPRTQAGGFWHKKMYPNQMWLDGLYMAEPFYAEYSQVFNQPAGFDDVAKQFALIEKHLLDPKTGLLYHGYDESRTSSGPTKPPASRPISGTGAWAGTPWRWWTCWIISPRTTRSGPSSSRTCSGWRRCWRSTRTPKPAPGRW